MEPVTKQRINSLLKELNYVEPPEAKMAIRITKIAYIPMITSVFCWAYLSFSIPNHNIGFYTIMLLSGTLLFGLTLMLLNFGTYLYFTFSKSKTPHWLYKGVFRTINSFFYWGSYLILFFFTATYHSSYDLEFVLIFLLISSPVIILYNITRNSKIREWLVEKIRNS